MAGLFGSTGLLGRQLGSLASLVDGFDSPQFDEGLSGTLLDPTQPQFGRIQKLAGSALGFGQTDPLTGSMGGITKLKGADLGGFGASPAPTPTPATGQVGVSQGGSGNVGGDWAGVERWANEINAAAAKYGVPANLIKAIMKLESNGDPNAAGAPGVWGPMQVHSGVWGEGPWSYDPAANIMKGVEILRGNYDQYGSWEMAVRAYLGFGTDMYGTTDERYWEVVSNNWNALNSAGGTAGLGFAGGSSGSLQAIFGGSAGVPDWGEFGTESGNGLYGYGSSYGLSGTQHTGVDVPMPVGSPMFAPMGGVVTCAGTGDGAGAEGGGCGAFGCQDYCAGSAGRIEVLLDNGVVLIFGHSSTSALRPGMRFQAGALLGTSGGMNSAHVHLEARVRDGSTPSGWRIVDPRTVLGGAVGAPGGGQAVGAGGGGSTGAYALLQRLRQGR